MPISSIPVCVRTVHKCNTEYESYLWHVCLTEKAKYDHRWTSEKGIKSAAWIQLAKYRGYHICNTSHDRPCLQRWKEGKKRLHRCKELQSPVGTVKTAVRLDCFGKRTFDINRGIYDRSRWSWGACLGNRTHLKCSISCVTDTPALP